MNTEQEHDDSTKREDHVGIMNWPAALMLVLWLLVILGVSGIEAFSVLSSPVVLGIILVAAVGVTVWSAIRYFKSSKENA